MLAKGAEEFCMTKSEYLRRMILAREIAGRFFTMDKEQGKELLTVVNSVAKSIALYEYDTRRGIDRDELIIDYYRLLNLLGQVPFVCLKTMRQWTKDAQELITKAKEEAGLIKEEE